MTRTIAKLKLPEFAESGSGAYVRSALLHSPIALGDHITQADWRDVNRSIHSALDNGCVTAWYSPSVCPKQPTLTAYMYPFTPIELHEGYLIGRERILTDRSGLFGWGDRSNFEAHVFDAEGKETIEVKVPKVERDGKTYAEVRIPEGYSVAIVRVTR